MSGHAKVVPSYVPVDVIVLLSDVLTAGGRGLKRVLGLRRRPTRSAHSQSRYATLWPELVAHYAVALFTWTITQNQRDASDSAVGRVPRVIAASVATAVTLFVGVQIQ